MPRPSRSMAGLTRLELAASCVTGRRSNQLNYNPGYLYRCDRGRGHTELCQRTCRDATTSTGKSLGRSAIKPAEATNLGGTRFELVTPCV